MSAGKGQYNLRGKITIKKPEQPINFNPAHRSTEFNIKETENNPFQPSSSLLRSQPSSPTVQEEADIIEKLGNEIVSQNLDKNNTEEYENKTTQRIQQQGGEEKQDNLTQDQQKEKPSTRCPTFQFVMPWQPLKLQLFHNS